MQLGWQGPRCAVTPGGTRSGRDVLTGGYAGPWTSSSLLLASQGYVLRGWVDLTSDKPHTVKKSIKYLEQGLQDTKDVLGLMGKVGSEEGRARSIPDWAFGARDPPSDLRPHPQSPGPSVGRSPHSAGPTPISHLLPAQSECLSHPAWGLWGLFLRVCPSLAFFRLPLFAFWLL